MLKASELIEALEEGKLLFKDCNRYDVSDFIDIAMFQYCYIDIYHMGGYEHKSICVCGWGSYNKSEVIMNEIVLQPEKWQIHDFMPSDKPWSNKKCNIKFDRLNKLKEILD
jgi:hypothetical protein